MSVLHLDDQTFHETIQSGTTLVDFWASWCGPCKALTPVVEELGDELLGKATVAKVNVDEDKVLAKQFQVMSIPTVIFFKDGDEKERLVGTYPKERYLEVFSQL